MWATPFCGLRLWTEFKGEKGRRELGAHSPLSASECGCQVRNCLSFSCQDFSAAMEYNFELCLKITLFFKLLLLGFVTATGKVRNTASKQPCPSKLRWDWRRNPGHSPSKCNLFVCSLQPSSEKHCLQGQSRKQVLDSVGTALAFPPLTSGLRRFMVPELSNPPGLRPAIPKVGDEWIQGQDRALGARQPSSPVQGGPTGQVLTLLVHLEHTFSK